VFDTSPLNADSA